MMRLYFAYGSNMHRARLEERVGPVAESLGHAVLEGYVHSFSHKGRDGSGKGNIEVATGELVRGVLYRMTTDQVALLDPYEGGYDMAEVQVDSADGKHRFEAYTYIAIKDAEGLLPREFYVAHYLRGMQENGFPQSYIDRICRQAKS